MKRCKSAGCAVKGLLPAPLCHAVTADDLALVQLLKCDWEALSTIDWMPCDWTQVVRKALHHGVAGLVCRAIAQGRAAAIPADLLNAAVIYLDHAHKQGDLRVCKTLEVLQTLDADDIPVVAFKGIALGSIAHRSATLRPSRDIDVLVPRECMARAIATLGALGYRSTDVFGPRVMTACYALYGQDILFAKERMPVEPHWSFVPGNFAVDADLAGIWQRTMTIDITGHSVRTLSLEDTVTVACLHGAKEQWWRLLWVADVAALLHRHPQLDWDAIVRRSSRAGVLRVLRLGLGLASEVFHAPLPPEIAKAIDADPTCRRLIDQSKLRLFDDHMPTARPMRVSRYYWQMRERPRDRVRYVLRTIMTPQFIHYRMIALPDAFAFAYVVVKLVHDYLLLPAWLIGKRLRWNKA